MRKKTSGRRFLSHSSTWEDSPSYFFIILFVVLLAFIGCSTKEEEKPAEFAYQGLSPDVTKYILKQVKQITSALVNTQAESSPYNEMLAKSYREQALKHFEQGDSESLQEAVIKLGKSMEYRYNKTALIELAYIFSCLAHAGVNPELNLLRSEGILDTLSTDPTEDGLVYLEDRAVLGMILARQGKHREALRLMKGLEIYAGKQPVEMQRNWLCMEVRYLLEPDWKERLTLSDELLRIDPDNPRYYNYSGLANYHTRQKDVAIQCFERAVAINDAYLPAVSNLDLMRRDQPPALLVRAPLGGEPKPEPVEFPYAVTEILPFKQVKVEGFQVRHSDALPIDTAWLYLTSEPSGTEVYVNAERRGTANPVFLATNLPTGVKMELSLRKEGYIDRNWEMEIAKGVNRIQGIKLEEKPGILHVKTEPPGAKIIIDGEERGVTPADVELEKGKYRIRLKKEGYSGQRIEVKIDNGEFVNLERDLLIVNRVLGEVWVGYEVEMTFIWLPGGCFQMGCGREDVNCDDDEKPVHQVCLSGFWMGRTEVTQGEWIKVMRENPSYFKSCGDACPVEEVSWFDAVRFCNRLSVLEGLTPAYEIKGQKVTWKREAEGYRLPTEAEWEYAARSGTESPFPFGKCLSTDEANYEGKYPLAECREGAYRDKPIPVGILKPNPWGLFDMQGNVWEWCWDWYGDYSSEKEPGPAGPTSGIARVIRGGGWISSAHRCRSAFRYNFEPKNRDYSLGFRLCKSSE